LGPRQKKRLVRAALLLVRLGLGRRIAHRQRGRFVLRVEAGRDHRDLPCGFPFLGATAPTGSAPTRRARGDDLGASLNLVEVTLGPPGDVMSSRRALDRGFSSSVTRSRAAPPRPAGARAGDADAMMAWPCPDHGPHVGKVALITGTV